MHRKKTFGVGPFIIGMAAGIIVSILIPDTLIILVLAFILLLVGILFLK